MASPSGRDELPAPIGDEEAPETGASKIQPVLPVGQLQFAPSGNDEQDVTTAAMHAECTRSIDADAPRSGSSSWDAPHEADEALHGRDPHSGQNATGEKKNSSEGEGEKLSGQILSPETFSGEDFFSEDFSILTNGDEIEKTKDHDGPAGVFTRDW